MYKNLFVKRFLFIYAISVALVLIYFIFKMLFLEEKEIEYKSFSKPQEKVETEEVVENIQDEEKRFILLPKK